MEIPLYQEIRDGAPVSLLMHLAVWRVTGPDRERWLNGQVTNQVKGLAPGATVRAAVCSSKGRMQGDVWITEHKDAYWVTARAGLREVLGPRLDQYLIADDCELTDVTDDWEVWCQFNGGSPGGVSDGFRTANPFRFGGPSADLFLPRGTDTSALADPREARDAAEALRLEHALPMWGAELNEKTLPPEAGFDRFGISYTKGCYIGQETIARLRSVGHVNRHLCCLSGRDQNITPGDELEADGRKVALVTSVSYSPQLEATLALAYVKRRLMEPGTSLDLDGAPWTVVPPPLALEEVAAL
ncbi:MAG: glycine cleavage T C-terminal barrel domain-containing protein [Verrucomicrobiota bacterium]